MYRSGSNLPKTRFTTSKKSTFKFKGSFDKEKFLRNLKIDLKEAKALGIHLESEESSKSLKIHKFEPIEEEGNKNKMTRLPSIKGINLNQLPLISQKRQKSTFFFENNEHEEDNENNERMNDLNGKRYSHNYKVNKASYNNMKFAHSNEKSEMLDSNIIQYRRKILRNIKSINSNIRVINAINKCKSSKKSRNIVPKERNLNFLKTVYTVKTVQ